MTPEELAPLLWDAYAASFLSALPAERMARLHAKWGELTDLERASWLAAARDAIARLGGGQAAAVIEARALRALIAEILTHDVVNDYMDPDKVGEYRARAGLGGDGHG